MCRKLAFVFLDRMCYTLYMAENLYTKQPELAISSPISSAEALKLHPMTLAFIGDAVQSLYTRTLLALNRDEKMGALHREVTKVVKAVSQAAEAQILLSLFDDVEKDLFRRARNCKLHTAAKNADIAEYRRATGLEAVLGYLYLTGNAERLNALLKRCLEDCLADEQQ